MNVQFGIRRMVNNSNRKLADWIFVVPVQGSNMKCLSIISSFFPHTSNCACSLYQFWEKIESQNIFFFHFSSSTFSNTLDFIKVTFVSVSLSNSDIQIKDSLEQTFCTACYRLRQEGWKLFLKNLFELTEIVPIEKIQSFMNLLSVQLSQSFSHLPWRSLEICDEKIVTLRICGITDYEFLTVRNLLYQSWSLVNQSFCILNKVACQDQGKQACKDEALQHKMQINNQKSYMD